MDQKKIGSFLSELRKEQGMTQQQLADAIGVSNKTVSKWECGKGMPEISSITPLCQTLQINVNELLSGEHLPEDGYSEKAEENMMNLIQETEISKKKSRNSLSVIVVTLIAILLGGGFIVVSNGGMSMWVALLDWPTLLPMIIVPALFLLGTGLGGAFLQSFAIVIGKKKATSEEISRSVVAMKLTGNTLLGVGVLQTCIGFMAMLYGYWGSSLPIEVVSLAIPIALLGILYGLIGYLLLLPIRMKLEVLSGSVKAEE